MPPKKGTTNRKSVTIELITGVGASPSSQDLAKNGPVGPTDRVRWWNKDDRGHTLSFTIWPFVEPPEPIKIEAGKKSGWYTVYAGTSERSYDYAIKPTINPASGPPDEPDIVVGP